MSPPVFSSVVYLSPWLPLPQGWSKVGLDAVVNAGAPAGQVLAGRLRQGSQTLNTVVGGTPNEVLILPEAPLSAMLDYAVDVQWVASNTEPSSITWTAGNYATAPVLTAAVNLNEASIDGTTVNLGWAFDATATSAAGANVSAYNGSGVSAGFNRVQGTTGTLPLNTNATPGTQLYLQAVLPISGTPGTDFAAPYTMGPIVSGLPLPLEAPAITSAAFDGTNAKVEWTAPTAPTTGGSVSYNLVVQSAGATSQFSAGSSGGLAVLGTGAAADLSVAGQVRYGAIAGAPGTALALLGEAPGIDGIAISGDHVSARITFPAGSPSGATATAKLLLNGIEKGSVTAATSAATVSIPGLTASPTDGWTVQASMQATGSGAALTGPEALPADVLAAAPTVSRITMQADPGDTDKWIVTVEAGSPPPPDTTLTIVLSQGSTTVATANVNATNIAHFSLTQGTAAANTIDGTAAATATLTLASSRATSPAATATFVGSVPTISAVQNIGAGDPTGGAQGLQIDVATAVSGQVLTVQLTSGDIVILTGVGPAGSSHVNIPLTQALDPALEWYVQARWTGDGVDTATFGGWSAPVAVLTSTTSVLSADFDADTLTLLIQPPQGVSPAQGAYIFAYDAAGNAIRGTSVVGTRGSFSLTPGNAIWQAGAKPFQPLPAGPSSRSLAPSSALVPVLLTAPALSKLDYDGTVLSATWSVVTDGDGNSATGAVVKVSDGTGTTVTAAAGSSSGEVAIQLPQSAQGTATFAVRATCNAATIVSSGAFCAAVAPLVAAPSIGTVTIDTTNNKVEAVITALASMPSGTEYDAWLMAGDHAVAGPVTGTTSLSFDYTALGVAGLTIVAQARASVSSVALTGPRTAPVPVLAIAPEITAVSIAPSSTVGNWVLDASWRPPVNGSTVTGYTLRLAKGGTTVFETPFGSTTTGSKEFPNTGLSTTEAYTLSLQATSANGSLTPVSSAEVWFSVPPFTAVTTGEERVSAQWTTPAGPADASYQLSLMDTSSSSVLAAVTTSATNGGIDLGALGLDASGNYALSLSVMSGPVVFSPASDGTAKTRAPLLLARPLSLTAATDAGTGKATISWQPVTNASGYTLSFSDGRTPVPASAASHTLSAALAPDDDLSITITANIIADGVTTTGPASDPIAVPTHAPALVVADYDGTNVSASWQPVAGATGYVATLLDKTGAKFTASPQTAETGISYAAALVSGNAPYTIVVQAISEAGSGLPSTSMPVFSTAWFVSTDAPATQPPHVYPAATLARTADEITIYLPPLADHTIAVATVGAFALAANTDPGSSAAFPYTLTFASDSNVWTFASDGNPLPPIRAQVQTDYVNFLKAAEVAGASSWGIAALQLAISRWMPQTFEETHYYAYGLDLTGGKGTGSLDLRQGLVLRVGFADYTNVWSGDTNSWLNGFGGGSPVDFDVADTLSGSGVWQLAMDAFISLLTASGAMTVAPPATVVSAESAAGVADSADLFFPGFPNPFYRLFFPGQLETPSGTGSVDTTANFALASAATYTALSSASSTPGASTPVVYFRGRAVLRLMIRVRVNDVELVVPLGTTVGNLLDRYGVRPPSSLVQLAGVQIERGAGPGIAVFGTSPTPPPAVYNSASRYLVRLDWSTMANYGGPVDATNLPLLHGDRIEF